MADAPETYDGRLERVEAALAAFDRRLRAVEARQAAAERGAPGEAVEVGESVTPAEAAAAGFGTPGVAPAEQADLVGVLSLVGRTLMVLGGAYLLRALTETGRVPSGAGVVMGLAYALAWLVAADRAAGRARPLSGHFHGFAAVLIGLPLLWEASTRFGFLGAPASAAALTALTGVAFGVSWRRRLHGLAGAATLGAIATAVGLIGATGEVLPFAVFLVALGVATLWLGYERDWYWLRWVAAFVANVVLLGLTSRALGTEPRERPEAVIAVLLLMLTAYLVSFAARTLVRGRLVIVFEVVQTVAALAIGLGGALAVARASGAGVTALGVASLLIGAGCYAVAFAFVSRRQGLGANFYFYTTLALVLAVAGCGVLLRGATLGATFALLAVVTTWLGYRTGRVALTLHGAVYAAGAYMASGLLGTSMAALAGTPSGAWPTVSLAAWIALTAAVVCVFIPRPRQSEAPPSLVALPRVVMAVLGVTGVGGAVVSTVAPFVAGMPPDPGVLATLRTTVVAAAAIVLALATHVPRLVELGWLLYPVLILGGLKLLVDDFRHSQAATLFVALALYGAALVLAPRLMKRTPHHS